MTKDMSCQNAVMKKPSCVKPGERMFLFMFSFHWNMLIYPTTIHPSSQYSVIGSRSLI